MDPAAHLLNGSELLQILRNGALGELKGCVAVLCVADTQHTRASDSACGSQTDIFTHPLLRVDVRPALRQVFHCSELPVLSCEH